MSDASPSDVPASEPPASRDPVSALERQRALMRKVSQAVDEIERGHAPGKTVHAAADQIIARFRDDLGIYGGRLYERDGDAYVLRTTFPDARPVAVSIRIPVTYPPVEACLLRGTVYMAPDDPRIDPAIEEPLGVAEFAAVELSGERYLLGFNVAPGHDRQEILSSLGVVRHAINQRLRREWINQVLREAKQIHESILPQAPPVHGAFDIAGRNASMESVGGDLYDFIPISDRILGVAVADVSGHGLPAALQVRDIYTGLRMGLARDFKIVRTIERLNTIIHQSTMTSRYASLFYGELEQNGMFIYTNAGHPPPIHIWASDDRVVRLDQGGPVLGPLRDATYNRGMAHVQSGDILAIYSDGVTEAMRQGVDSGDPNDEYGTERLIAVLRDTRGRSSAAVIDAVFADLARWTGDASPGDDRTLVIVQRPADD
ncbi:MAG: SpoIIE family protein phosphatase [Acidobacteriota bacterium]